MVKKNEAKIVTFGTEYNHAFYFVSSVQEVNDILN